MEIKSYSLKKKGKKLVDNCNLSFYSGAINHIVGKNGVGKSQLAKDFLLNNSGHITKSIAKSTTLISSFSNVPNDITKNFLLNILRSKFQNNQQMLSDIYNILNIEEIPANVQIK